METRAPPSLALAEFLKTTGPEDFGARPNATPSSNGRSRPARPVILTIDTLFRRKPGRDAASQGKEGKGAAGCKEGKEGRTHEVSAKDAAAANKARHIPLVVPGDPYNKPRGDDVAQAGAALTAGSAAVPAGRPAVSPSGSAAVPPGAPGQLKASTSTDFRGHKHAAGIYSTYSSAAFSAHDYQQTHHRDDTSTTLVDSSSANDTVTYTDVTYADVDTADLDSAETASPGDSPTLSPTTLHNTYLNSLILPAPHEVARDAYLHDMRMREERALLYAHGYSGSGDNTSIGSMSAPAGILAATGASVAGAPVTDPIATNFPLQYFNASTSSLALLQQPPYISASSATLVSSQAPTSSGTSTISSAVQAAVSTTTTTTTTTRTTTTRRVDFNDVVIVVDHDADVHDGNDSVDKDFDQESEDNDQQSDENSSSYNDNDGEVTIFPAFPHHHPNPDSDGNSPATSVPLPNVLASNAGASELLQDIIQRVDLSPTASACTSPALSPVQAQPGDKAVFQVAAKNTHMRTNTAELAFQTTDAYPPVTGHTNPVAPVANVETQTPAAPVHSSAATQTLEQDSRSRIAASSQALPPLHAHTQTLPCAVRHVQIQTPASLLPTPVSSQSSNTPSSSVSADGMSRSDMENRNQLVASLHAMHAALAQATTERDHLRAAVRDWEARYRQLDAVRRVEAERFESLSRGAYDTIQALLAARGSK